MIDRRPAGHLAAASPRAAAWQALFGSPAVPLRSMCARWIELPEHGLKLCYELDVPRLTPAQRERLRQHLGQRFELPPDQVELELDAVPILQEDVTVTFDARVFL